MKNMSINQIRSRLPDPLLLFLLLLMMNDGFMSSTDLTDLTNHYGRPNTAPDGTGLDCTRLDWTGANETIERLSKDIR